jgi:acetolactate synthase-1/2/3 large subunit
MLIEDLIAKRLREAGVTRFFGIPGGPSIPYMEAFRRAGIEFVLTAHEASAAMMADVTARLTGVPGVCHATFGPGAVNLASGVGGALLDRSPLLALTTEMPDEWLGRTAQMNIDQQALFRPLTKATFRLSAGNAGEVMERTLDLAGEEYPGPVHIGLPSDIAGRSARITHGSHSEAGSRVVLDGDSRSPDGSALNMTGGSPPAHVRKEESEHAAIRAGVLIASARRPLIAAGLTALRTGAGRALHEFLEKHGVPVIVTPMAKGVIPYDHPCYAGVLFHALSDRLDRLIREADLVIGLGYDPVEYNYESWLPQVPLVHFDTRPSDLRIKGAIEIVSGPDGWFRALAPLNGSSSMTELAAEARMSIREGIYREAPGLNPVRVLALLREALPSGATVTADVGSHLHLLGQMWDVQKGRLIMTNGWSSMGFGLPAAVAAAMAGTGGPVVCVTGDGGFMMHAGEMITARRLGLKITVIVFSDGELNLIKLKQSWKKVNPYGIQLYSGSLFGKGSFLGAAVIRVTDEAGMRNALARALNHPGTVIIDAAVDPAIYDGLTVRR